MKAITIKQPWPSLIVHGIKDIENRTWKTNFRGRVLIHSAATKDNRKKPLLTDRQYELARGTSGYGKHIFGDLGSIIGSVEIVDCVINHPSIWAEKTPTCKCNFCGIEIADLSSKKHFCSCCGKLLVKGTHYQSPIYNWVLANPIIYANPIPAKGKLSFWDYPGIEEVKIECPECGSIEIAVEDHTTEPFSTYLHSCNKCGNVIMESEWNVIK